MKKWAFLIIAILCACGGSSMKRANMLLDDVRGYHDGLRWERFSQAVLRLPPAERGEFLEVRDELSDDLRISDYDIVRVHYLKKDMRAEVVVKYMWHLDSRGIVHRTSAREIWERRGKRWILTSEIRSRGKEMPGLDEPEKEPEEEKSVSRARPFSHDN